MICIVYTSHVKVITDHRRNILEDVAPDLTIKKFVNYLDKKKDKKFIAHFIMKYDSSKDCRIQFTKTFGKTFF